MGHGFGGFASPRPSSTECRSPGCRGGAVERLAYGSRSGLGGWGGDQGLMAAEALVEATDPRIAGPPSSSTGGSRLRGSRADAHRTSRPPCPVEVLPAGGDFARTRFCRQVKGTHRGRAGDATSSHLLRGRRSCRRRRSACPSSSTPLPRDAAGRGVRPGSPIRSSRGSRRATEGAERFWGREVARRSRAAWPMALSTLSGRRDEYARRQSSSSATEGVTGQEIGHANIALCLVDRPCRRDSGGVQELRRLEIFPRSTARD